MALGRCHHLQRALSGFSKSFFNNYQHRTADSVTRLLSPSSWEITLNRYSSFKGSPSVDRYQAVVHEYEAVENPPEWKYVERLLPIATVPKPPKSGEFPSGWRPQNPELYEKLPYFVNRSKNHMIPVHLDITHRGSKKVTEIRRIHGDVWTLSEDIEKYLKKKHRKVFAVTVNEYTSCICIRGDYVLDTREYLLSVGL